MDQCHHFATSGKISEPKGKMKNYQSLDELHLMSEHLKCGG